MKQVHGIWFPEDDAHFGKGMIDEAGNYQKDIFDAAMSYVRKPKIFYDIGAHVGLWSLMAIKSGFRTIHAYEPNPETFECLRKNLANKDGGYKANLNKCGVSEYTRLMHLVKENEGNSGAVKLTNDDNGLMVPVVNINYHCNFGTILNRSHEALIKIDTEGMEVDCIRGMDKIILTLKPVICVEQRTNHDALKLLQGMGMEIVQQVRKDYILTWK